MVTVTVTGDFSAVGWALANLAAESGTLPDSVYTDKSYIYYMYEKSQLSRLVWGSLMLAPITSGALIT